LPIPSDLFIAEEIEKSLLQRGGLEQERRWSMVEVYQASEQSKVSCETCLKEIPESEARSREASDYFAYFCGLDCYQEWGRHHIKSEMSP
jgi:hypothetical protein